MKKDLKQIKMKNILSIKTLSTLFLLAFISLSTISCSRDNDFEADDLPQEELTNIVLHVKNLTTNNVQDYNYSVGSGVAPAIKLEDGKSYEVTAQFMNGSEDVTSEIEMAKDEHFLIFNFPKSDIQLERLDTPNKNGLRVGLKTKWTIVKAVKDSSPKLIMTLIHKPASANENLNGTAWGGVTGGETDAEATFGITN